MPSEYGEQDPLLAREASPVRRQKTRLPRLQLFLVMSIQFSEPVTATVIFPFINQLVRETGITGGDERKTGYYAGVVESLFYLTEALTVYQWGKLSDTIGRRPVLLIGALLSSISIFGFGLSTKFWMLIVTRSIQGICNGNIGVSKSIVAEITDSTNLADAVALSPMLWAMGVTVGPILGGTLSRPADRWPNLFSGSFFRDYPYFLACASAAMVPLISFSICYLYLKETLGSVVGKNKAAAAAHRAEAESLIDREACMDGYTAIPPSPESTLDPPSEAHSMKALLANKDVFAAVVNHSFLALLEQSHNVLMPLMYSTSIENGGLGFSPFKIGTILGVLGFINGVLQLLLFPGWLKRLGPKRLYIIGYSFLFIALAAYPVMSKLAKSAGTDDAKVWAVLVVQLWCLVMVYMAYGCAFMYIFDSAPSKASLGATNGLAQMMGTAMRTIAPTLASSLFSISLQHQIMGGSMVYWLLCIIGLTGLYTSALLPSKLKQY